MPIRSGPTTVLNAIACVRSSALVTCAVLAALLGFGTATAAARSADRPPPRIVAPEAILMGKPLTIVAVCALVACGLAFLALRAMRRRRAPEAESQRARRMAAAEGSFHSGESTSR
jgi:hypothetical protein